MKRALLAAAVVLVTAAPARADSGKLAEARRAADEIRYDDAQRLLVQALEEGGNSPAAVIAIYELSATTAAVLGKAELAEQYYRRLLALKPDARVPDGVSPKLREPFVAARAHMAAHGKLDARAARHAATGAIDVELVSDPLAMAVGAAIVTGGVAATPVPFADRRATITPPTWFDAVAIVDELGNQLLAIPASALGVVVPPPPPRAVHVPWYRRWKVWGIATAVSAATAFTAGLYAREKHAELNDIVTNSYSYTYQDAQEVRDRRDQAALATNIMLGVAGACAAATAITYFTRPDERPRAAIVPTVAPGAVGLAITGDL